MRVTLQFDVTWASSLPLLTSVMRSSPYRWHSLLFPLLTGPAKAGQLCVLAVCQWSMPPAPSLGRVPGGLLGLHCIVPQYETSDASIILFSPSRSTVVIRLWLFLLQLPCMAANSLEVQLPSAKSLNSWNSSHTICQKVRVQAAHAFTLHYLLVSLFCHFSIVRRIIINVLLSTCPAKIYNIKFPLLISIIFMIELVALHPVYIWLK